jgi:ParB family chromosome partitioning protein
MLSKNPRLASSARADFNALFGAKKGETLPVATGGFKLLSHNLITVRPQVRQSFPQEEIDELRASIRALKEQGQGIEGTGVLQALLVCPESEGYRLIAGEKRFRATKAEGLKNVPCIVISAPDSEATIRLLQLTENTMRTSPPVLEEARAIRETMEVQQLSLREMARLLGKTLGYVTNRLSVLKMRDDVQRMVAKRSDTLKHAALLERVEDEELRRELIRSVIEEEISVKELERRISSSQEKDSSPAEVFSRENTSDNNSSQQATENRNQKTVLSSVEESILPAKKLVANAIKSLKEIDSSEGFSPEIHQAVEALEKEVTKLRKMIGEAV